MSANPKRLDAFHCMIVTKYFSTIEDFISIEFVCKKFNGNMSKFHYNPIPLNLFTLKFFPHIETFHLYTEKDYSFSSTKFYRRVIWTPTDYTQCLMSENENFDFKNVIFSRLDLKKCRSVTSNTQQTTFEEKALQATELVTFTVPSCVRGLSEFCFSECMYLKNVVLPDSITSLGNCCFANCHSLSTFTVPHCVRSLAFGCFQSCKNLSQIELSQHLTSLGGCCFYGCSSLEQLHLPCYLETIGEYCFTDCKSLKHLSLTKTPLKEVKKGCFSGCVNLGNIDLPTSVTNLGDYCFYGCNSLESLYIPKSVEVVGTNCFCATTHTFLTS
ncbi:hypothetical protein EIN_475980 [Entamoeba invadens IP1]|uniref:Leucine rich repeat containing protein BspA family protein n=1 Tax=Entamoeba invadens IP1 TaxID=370355 RepID=A0A0A1U408_ENTIV|nr:hypothetical protein EIN_475980 [Entamoeba invadens IP1]ELP88896.1 hypothetical protein EIN_475980 [Entamoeba invadens IP1]|eukprot:XP_004255667.1 hypothetical protein EIN_475980 [Entamoeba invadens IP1]